MSVTLILDERALVQGAARLGWVLSSRTPETLTVRQPWFSSLDVAHDNSITNKKIRINGNNTFYLIWNLLFPSLIVDSFRLRLKEWNIVTNCFTFWNSIATVNECRSSSGRHPGRSNSFVKEPIRSFTKGWAVPLRLDLNNISNTSDRYEMSLGS